MELDVDKLLFLNCKKCMLEKKGHDERRIEVATDGLNLYVMCIIHKELVAGFELKNPIQSLECAGCEEEGHNHG